MPENVGGAFQQTVLLGRDLARMNIELLPQLDDRLVAPDRGQSNLRLECRRMRPAALLRHVSS